MTVKINLPQPLSPCERTREATAILATAIARLHANRPDTERGFPWLPGPQARS